ncbi:kelch repeat-containing protein At3g27220 isoform X2 [Selaginella moellendorffii]|uniref:kelch repeat-containing protein At3g27220 isoform X2 n=1 Tax=Selaginella moellendorffii TaxID=88036 RepID=UPI000D1C9C24|nr:kelch repeat-containing protein At3g27220 isoform X2 [Selaginella moellendorffii]|eukprot:XP_024515472.1 kelch repeat-containing protein At3g27220 isoform X2 [Selaginella moellendorffii]
MDLLEPGVPEIQWEEIAECPVKRLDGAAVQIRNLLYVFAGYATIDEIHSHVNVLDLMTNTWIDTFDMPKEMAHSHLGMVTDGRFVYVVTGQYGPQCRGPTNLNFVLDTETKSWDRLPPLPVPRYAPATQLWRGRLHVMGGSKEDRWEPALEHWSLAVKDGKAVETKWRAEIPIPRGGPHRACIVFGDRLFVIGGQEGDYKPKPGSPIFKCSRQRERRLHARERRKVMESHAANAKARLSHRVRVGDCQRFHCHRWRHHGEESSHEKDGSCGGRAPIQPHENEMEDHRTHAVQGEDNAGGFLGWMALFYIGAARQRRRRSCTEEDCRQDMENKVEARLMRTEGRKSELELFLLTSKASQTKEKFFFQGSFQEIIPLTD